MKIFYHEQMSVHTESEAKSSQKPGLFVEQAKKISDVSIIENFGPVSKEQLEYAHSNEYISHIFERKIPNGFMNYDIQVAESSLWNIASLYHAGQIALINNEITCSPTSGFHHAQFDEAAGYCTFNGLIVAARMLIESGQTKRIAILDCDFHYGDGTDQIINKLNIHNIKNFSFGKTFKKGASSEEYLENLYHTCKFLNNGYDLIIYQAGADLHDQDPLGGILNTQEMQTRDQIVFNEIKAPITWNLAGGYHHDYQQTIDLHLNTLDIALKTQQTKSIKKFI